MGKFVALALVLSGLAFTSRPPTPPLHPHDFRPLLLRPALAQTISKPFVPALVELLWLRSLNAIGLKDSVQKNQALYEYGVVLSELDPKFYQVYEYLGLNIPFADKRDHFVGGDLACDLFERGLKAFPQDRKLHMYLGFSLFHHQRKFGEASDVFARAARLPDALDWMGPLATRLKAQTGKAEDALQLTHDLLASNLDDEVRAQLEKRAQELAIEVVLQRVDRAAEEFTKSVGRPPRDFAELKDQHFYEGAFLDPSQGFISLDANGKATSTSLERRMEIYE